MKPNATSTRHVKMASFQMKTSTRVSQFCVVVHRNTLKIETHALTVQLENLARKMEQHVLQLNHVQVLTKLMEMLKTATNAKYAMLKLNGSQVKISQNVLSQLHNN